MFDKLVEFQNLICSSSSFEFISEDLSNIKFKIIDDLTDVDSLLDKIVAIKSLFTDCISINSTSTPYLPLKINESPLDIFSQDLEKHLIKLKSLYVEKSNYDLVINKNKLTEFFNQTNNKLSYCLFWDDKYLISLFQQNLTSLKILNDIFISGKHNIILFLNKDIYVKNNYVELLSIHKFDSNSIDINENALIDHNKKITFRRTCCNIEFDIGNLSPDMFFFEYSLDFFAMDNVFKTHINNFLLELLILYISSYSNSNSNQINSKINGEKVIDITLALDSLNIYSDNNIKELFNLYFLAYNSSNIQTLYMIRNILSIFLCEDCSSSTLALLFKNCAKILETVQHNLNILSLKDVDKYFSTRYTLFDFLHKSSDSLQQQLNSMIEKMNKTYLSTIASLVAVSFVYLKDRNINILRLSLLAYVLYLILDGISTFTNNIKSFKSYLIEYNTKRNSFDHILSTNEFKEAKKFEEEISKLKKRFYFNFYSFIGIYCIMIIFLLGLFFNTVYLLNFIKNTLLLI